MRFRWMQTTQQCLENNSWYEWEIQQRNRVCEKKNLQMSNPIIQIKISIRGREAISQNKWKWGPG